MRSSTSADSPQDPKLVSALLEALLAMKTTDTSAPSLEPGYDDAEDILRPGLRSESPGCGDGRDGRDGRDGGDGREGKDGNRRSDSAPSNIQVGAVNPYALVEALLGRNLDTCSVSTARILSDVLQTEYDELFDMKFKSVLFAGLQLNEKDNRAERVSEKDMKILSERDLETPDLSSVRELKDLEKLGLKDLASTHVKMARIRNGKVHLLIDAHSVARTVSNRAVTRSVNELVTPFRVDKGRWTPPNGAWRDMYDDFFQRVSTRHIGDLSTFHINDHCETMTMSRFDDPVQGCTSNSWLIAALFSVFWSDPHMINRATRVFQDKKRLQVKFHDKGGRNNAKTETVEVNYEIPISNSSNTPMYCRSSDNANIWPSLYEKAFTKWITGDSSEHPDITQTASGDPVKAMAQINGREPHYYRAEKQSGHDLIGLVRANCVNCKTINPMTAWTYPTGSMYRGSTIVANHAYSVLGYTCVGYKQYIVLRNPWGVSEPVGLNGYPGVLERVKPEMWRPASLLDNGGLFAMEANMFQECFQYIGVAK